MVLSSLSRPLLVRSTAASPIASTTRAGLTRALHHSSVAVSPAAASSRSRPSLLSSTSTTTKLGGAAAPLPLCLNSKLGLSTSIRSLTYDFPRKKVKVLMVLYDGGKHAEEVSFFLSPLHWRRWLLRIFGLHRLHRHNVQWDYGCFSLRAHLSATSRQSILQLGNIEANNVQTALAMRGSMKVVQE